MRVSFLLMAGLFILGDSRSVWALSAPRKMHAEIVCGRGFESSFDSYLYGSLDGVELAGGPGEAFEVSGTLSIGYVVKSDTAGTRVEEAIAVSGTLELIDNAGPNVVAHLLAADSTARTLEMRGNYGAPGTYEITWNGVSLDRPCLLSVTSEVMPIL